jgi:hypothetical protein
MSDENQPGARPTDMDNEVEMEMVSRLIVAASESEDALDGDDIDRVLGIRAEPGW